MKSNAYVNGYLEGYMAKQAVLQYPASIAPDAAAPIGKEEMMKANAFKQLQSAKTPAPAVATAAPAGTKMAPVKTAGTAAAGKINKAQSLKKELLAD